ncbi:MAG: hypothetical protein [Olavius algarvensis Delta 4 endosymbiont]|nr:MAG: hypothetical protein [Olavius algarvensis Delta 4 endosymbiont]
MPFRPDQAAKMHLTGTSGRDIHIIPSMGTEMDGRPTIYRSWGGVP